MGTKAKKNAHLYRKKRASSLPRRKSHPPPDAPKSTRNEESKTWYWCLDWWKGLSRRERQDFLENLSPENIARLRAQEQMRLVKGSIFD